MKTEIIGDIKYSILIGENVELVVRNYLHNIENRNNHKLCNF